MRTKTHARMREYRIKARRRKIEYRWYWTLRGSPDGVRIIERSGYTLGSVVTDLVADINEDRRRKKLPPERSMLS